MWNSSKLYRLCCFRSPQTLSTWADKPAQTTQQGIWHTEMTLELCILRYTSEQGCKSQKNAGSFLKETNFWWHSKNLPSVQEFVFWSQASRWWDADCVFLFFCPGSLPSMQQTDTVYSSASCLWPAAMSILPWGSVVNPFLESNHAHVTCFMCLPVPPYLVWPGGEEKVHWGTLCIARIRVVFALDG